MLPVRAAFVTDVMVIAAVQWVLAQGANGQVSCLQGKQARLACEITNANSNPKLINWKKDDEVIYTVDGESGSGAPLMQATHIVDKRLEGRLHFFVSRKPAVLSINPVELKDRGFYSCTVQYENGYVKTVNVTLQVIALPKNLVIRRGNLSSIKDNAVDVHNEGDTLVLHCQVEGGDPTPSVTWWKNKYMLHRDARTTLSSNFTHYMMARQLARDDDGSTYSCKATNNNISEPLQRFVRISLRLSPFNVTIKGTKAPISANVPAEVECESYGAKPPATLSWWLGNRRLENASLSTSAEVSSSLLRFIPDSSHNGHNLTCRATNEILRRSIQDNWTLEVLYKPQVHLQLGIGLKASTINEGHDVYFECHTRANPKITEILWKLNGRDLHAGEDVVMSNQSLALQKIKRTSSGNYTCSAINREGSTESNSVHLKIKHAPVCSESVRTVYAASRHEEVSVICEVIAEPEDGLEFSWSFNNSLSRKDLTNQVLEATRSILKYTPIHESDFGTLQCFSRNRIGVMKKPCTFHIVPASLPSSVYNCTVLNLTEAALQVECQRDNGNGVRNGVAEPSPVRQRQHFVLEVHDAQKGILYRNVTSDSPTFWVHNLPPGTTYKLVVYAVNSKGKSEMVVLKTSTLALSEERHKQDTKWTVPCCSLIEALIVGISLLVIIPILIVLIMKYRSRLKPPRDPKKQCEPPATVQDKPWQTVVIEEEGEK